MPLFKFSSEMPSKFYSDHHLQLNFQVFLGSIARAFRIIINVDYPHV